MSNKPARRDDSGPGILCGAVLIMFAVALAGFWPAMVWHGYTDTGGWKWDIHSTMGELAWWGIVAVFSLLIRAGHRHPLPPSPPAAPPAPQSPPGPDPALTMRLLDGLDAIGRYEDEAERARTGEELDYLARHGHLPGPDWRTS